MLYITDIRIEPNPVETGGELTVEITIKEVFKDAKRYKGKYPYRYAGIMKAEGHKYPQKYPKK